MKKNKFKVGDKVKSGYMEGEVLIVYPETERTPVDFNFNQIGKSFIDYDLLVRYQNRKGKTIKGIWAARKTKLINKQ